MSQGQRTTIFDAHFDPRDPDRLVAAVRRAADGCTDCAEQPHQFHLKISSNCEDGVQLVPFRVDICYGRQSFGDYTKIQGIQSVWAIYQVLRTCSEESYTM